MKTTPASLGMRGELDDEGSGTLHYDGRVWEVRKHRSVHGVMGRVELFWRATDTSGKLNHIDGETPMDLRMHIIFGTAYAAAQREAKPQW